MRSRSGSCYDLVGPAWRALQCGSGSVVSSPALGPALETVADGLHVLRIVIHPDTNIIIINYYYHHHHHLILIIILISSHNNHITITFSILIRYLAYLVFIRS